MPRFDGSLAVKLDFGSTTTTSTATARPIRRDLRLAAGDATRRPEKYASLERRRRRAQIEARRQMDLLDRH